MILGYYLKVRIIDIEGSAAEIAGIPPRAVRLMSGITLDTDRGYGGRCH